MRGLRYARLPLMLLITTGVLSGGCGTAEKAKPPPPPSPPESKAAAGNILRVDGSVNGIAFSADGARIAVGIRAFGSGSPPSAVTVWDRQCKQLAHLKTPAAVQAVGFAAGGLLVACAWIQSGQGVPPHTPAFYAWAAPDYRPVTLPKDRLGGAEMMAASPASHFVAIYNSDQERRSGKVTLIDSRTWKTAAEWETPDPGRCLAFSPDGRELAVVARHTVTFRTIGGPPAKDRQAPLEGPVFHCHNLLCYSADGKRLAVCDGGVTLRDRDLNVLKAVCDPPAQLSGGRVKGNMFVDPAPRYISAVAVSPDAQRVFYAHNEFGPYFFDTRTGTTRRIPVAEREVTVLTVSPDGKLLAVGGRTSGQVVLVDLTTQ